MKSTILFNLLFVCLFSSMNLTAHAVVVSNDSAIADISQKCPCGCNKKN